MEEIKEEDEKDMKAERFADVHSSCNAKESEQGDVKENQISTNPDIASE